MNENNENGLPDEAASRSSAGLGAVAWTDESGIIMREDFAVMLDWRGSFVGMNRAIPDSWKPLLYA
jgi:hypothetical protein